MGGVKLLDRLWHHTDCVSFALNSEDDSSAVGGIQDRTLSVCIGEREFVVPVAKGNC